MNAKNSNILSYIFLLTQQKLKSLNLETIRQLAIQFHLDPTQNFSFLISELSQILFLQTIGTQGQNSVPYASTGSENMHAYMQSYNETLQKYLLFSNIEKNYYNLMMSNSMRVSGLFQGNLEEQKKIQSQMMINNMNCAKMGCSQIKNPSSLELPKIQDFSKDKNCICNQENQIKENFNKIIQCTNLHCKSSFHEKCIDQSVSGDDFECPKCVLSSIDPFNRVIAQISEYFSIPTQNENLVYDLMFVINQDQMKKIMENQNVGIEIRSIRLNSKEMYETTWIDYGEIFLNNSKIHDLSPLNVSISLKKRKDEKIFTRESLNMGINFLKVVTKKITSMEKNQFKFCENAKHLIAIYLVEKQSWAQVSNSVRVLDERICHQKVLKKFILNNGSEKNNDDLAIKVDKITISMIDALDLSLIETPARGANCDHLQCFSLENYLKMMENSLPRKFQCPICKARSYNLYIDGHFLRILKEAKILRKNFSEITFLKDGSYLINENLQEKDNSIEELKCEDVFNHEEFCWNTAKNDFRELPSTSNHMKNPDVIIIEDEEPMKTQPMMMPIFNNQQNPMFLQNYSNNMFFNNDMNMLKMKQLQMQMGSFQMPQNQQFSQPNFTQGPAWNESVVRNQMEMERHWQAMQAGTNGYFRK